MDQSYPLVCFPPRDEGRKPDDRAPDADRSPPSEPPEAEPMADLPKEIWTKPLTQKQWEAACATIMHFAMHGGC